MENGWRNTAIQFRITIEHRKICVKPSNKNNGKVLF